MERKCIYVAGFCIFSYVLSKMFSTKCFTPHLNYLSAKTIAGKPTLSDLFRKPNIEGAKFFPIVYNENYDISFFNFERWHPFDTKKWSQIHSQIKKHFESNNKNLIFISPLRPIKNEELNLIHSEKFIQDIHSNGAAIADAAEVYYLRFVPVFMLNRKLLLPLKWQTAGSILAAKEALQHKWSINLGGGFHHASAHRAGGFCLFADISLIMKILWKAVDENLKFMIIDLDAHQGNGYETDVFAFPRYHQQQVYILDMYNPHIYPKDNFAKAMINRKVELNPHITDDEYLKKLEVNLNEAMAEFKPDLIIYNAGTDILSGDPLGMLDVTPDGVKKRDEMVFKTAKADNIPIVMLTSGGYQHSNAEIIANSIINLYDKNLIH